MSMQSHRMSFTNDFIFFHDKKSFREYALVIIFCTQNNNSGANIKKSGMNVAIV